MTSTATPVREQGVLAPPRTRLLAVAVVFGIGQLAPLAIPLVLATNLPAAWKTALSTVLMLGLPEAGILLGAAVLGKEGFAWLKGKIFKFLKRALPPDRVGPIRHRIGVTLFVIPLIMAWLLPYFEPLTGMSTLSRLPVYIMGDLMLVISLFVLGGEFWDKLRRLFLRQVK